MREAHGLHMQVSCKLTGCNLQATCCCTVPVHSCVRRVLRGNSASVPALFCSSTSRPACPLPAAACSYGLEFIDVSQAVAGCSFRVFAGALADGGCVKAIRVPQGSRVSNSRLKPPKGDIVSEAIAAGEELIGVGLYCWWQPCEGAGCGLAARSVCRVVGTAAAVSPFSAAAATFGWKWLH